MNQSKIDQIKALLALANSPNEHEAALANATAQKLMQKYLIDEDMLHAEKPELVVTRKYSFEQVAKLGLRYNLRDTQTLIDFHNSVAQYLKMVAVVWSTQRKLIDLVVYGFEFQHQIFEFVLESLLNQGKSALVEAIKAHGGQAFYQFWPSYLGALQTRIWKLGQSEQPIESALAIIDKVKAKVDADLPDLQRSHKDGYKQTNDHAVDAANKARFDKAVSADGFVKQSLLS